MRNILLAAAAMAALPTAAMAQETAPDGTPAFGIEPYIGVMGGYHDFDSDFRGPLATGNNKGAFVEGVAGVNIPLGPVFAGVEGNVAKGFSDLDWEYGVYGRVGARAGDSGLIYGKVGYQWVNLDGPGGKDDDWAYGVGVEVGPSDIGLGGITGNSGVRLRLEANTYDFQSIRPSAGLVFHF